MFFLSGQGVDILTAGYGWVHKSPNFDRIWGR